MYLAKDTILQGGKYKIERMLAQGGFGITYLGIQCGLERKVAIKEFFMKDLCERAEDSCLVTLGTKGSHEMVSKFRSKFLKEARNIAKLKHPHIVHIIDVFEENGTAYYVMEYAENGSLADKLKVKLYLPEAEATRYILQVASALDYIHQQKITHLDIKPANIMLNENDDVVLIDFGLSKQYDAETGEQTSTTPVGISEGYAPMEQYNKGGVGTFSPATDVYSLGATYLKLLTGVTPPSAIELINGDKTLPPLPERISKHVGECIKKAMTPQRSKRMQSVAEFMQMLGVKSVSPVTQKDVQPREAEHKEETKLDDIAKEEVAKPAVKKEPPATSSTNNFISTIDSIFQNIIIFFFGAVLLFAGVVMFLDECHLLKPLKEALGLDLKSKYENKHNPPSVNPLKKDTIKFVPKPPLPINNSDGTSDKFKKQDSKIDFKKI